MQFNLRGLMLLTALVTVTIWGASALGRNDAVFFGALFVMWISAGFFAGWLARESSTQIDLKSPPVVAGLLVNWLSWFFVTYLLARLTDPNTELVGDVSQGFELLLDAQRLRFFLILAILFTFVILLALWKRRSWTIPCVIVCTAAWGIIYWWGFIHASASLIYVD